MGITEKQRTFPWGLAALLVCVLALYVWTDRPTPALAGWETNFERALAEAAARDKKVLVAFYMNGCPYCVAMDRTVLGTEAVRSAIKTYVPVRVNMEEQRELSNRYAVFGAPTFAVLDAEGRLLTRSEGFQAAETFIKFLERASTTPLRDRAPRAARPSSGS